MVDEQASYHVVPFDVRLDSRCCSCPCAVAYAVDLASYLVQAVVVVVAASEEGLLLDLDAAETSCSTEVAVEV